MDSISNVLQGMIADSRDLYVKGYERDVRMRLCEELAERYDFGEANIEAYRKGIKFALEVLADVMKDYEGGHRYE